MTHITYIIGHPHFESSTANQFIVNEFKQQITKASDIEVDYRNLIQLYPQYAIDKQTEQNVLLQSDIIVLQFPFYWYSIPAILKLWIDEVFEYGFAYGSTGDKLKNKKLILSITTGGPEEAYHTNGRNHYEVIDLLKPLIQTSNLAGMAFQQPVISYAMNLRANSEELYSKISVHVTQLINTIQKESNEL